MNPSKGGETKNKVDIEQRIKLPKFYTNMFQIQDRFSHAEGRPYEVIGL